MPRSITSPDRLFDRTWRPGHPFGPRLSGTRRIAMAVLFFVLASIIGGYWFVTDSKRVKRIAEAYLSDLLGGRVEVGKASLSLFEGLKLEQVRLYADDANAPDSLLFTAKVFMVQHNPGSMLSGKLEATRILAIEPHLTFTENVETGRWNHQRLRAPRTPGGTRSLGTRVTLPEIVLRNARIDYSQLDDGTLTALGSIEIEGHLTPSGEPDLYRFKMQSRGAVEGMGASASGALNIASRQLTASLNNFRFGTDIKSLLPAVVRKWWEEHNLDGRLDIPELTVKPTEDPDRPEFRVVVDLRGVTLSVRPEEWLGEAEIQAARWTDSAFDILRSSGLNRTGFVDRMNTFVAPQPISLQQVQGQFVFTNAGIELREVHGKVEANAFTIDGSIRGYSPSAPFSIRVASSKFEDLYIPPAPRYINSMPQPVKEIYDHLRPTGVCRFWVRMDRDDSGGRPVVAGEVQILSGQFIFDKFPYPVRNATGRLIFSTNPETGLEQLEIVQIRGSGIAGGPNANANIEINGRVSPFGADTGVEVTITGSEIYSEPPLFAAFPPETRDALKMLDAPGKGEFPKFRGKFRCYVLRPVGLNTRWVVETDITLEDASGAFVVFPYPMSGVTGRLLIRDDHVQIIDVGMKDGDASIQMNGRIAWKSENPPATQPAAMQAPIAVESPVAGVRLQPELKIVARNVPVDARLLSALPEDRRKWVERIGLGGIIDLDGDVHTLKDAKPTESSIGFAFDVRLRDGTIWPAEGTFAASGVEGSMRLTPTQIVLSDIRAKRGEADLTAKGLIDWSGAEDRIVLSAEATNLTLDRALYGLLPERGRAAWDAVAPSGTVDASISFSGQAPRLDSAASSDAAGATTRPADLALDDRSSYEVTIKPRQLSVTPAVVPCKLDDVTGTIHITPRRVFFKNVVAKRGESSVSLNGVGDFEQAARWDLKLSAENVLVDNEFIKAVPKAISDLATGFALNGRLSFDFSKLVVTVPAGKGDGRDEPAVDVDFAVEVSAKGIAANVGVPLEGIDGVARFEGATRAGKLSMLEGTLDYPTMTLAGRAVTNFRAQVSKLPSYELVQVKRLEASIAGGRLAGQIDWAFPDVGPSRYAVALVLRDADVRKLTGDMNAEIRGVLGASLNLEGVVNDPGSRRGRGDVIVNGEKMMRIPLILGLLQITELALPITTPFSEAASRYTIAGDRVTFETIEMRSREMLMQGSGHLDFGTRQVRLTFVTESRNWPKLPIVGEILQGARNEMLQIQVRGTLQEPTVGGRFMNTFVTTVDEVFRGDGRDARSDR